jgi:hypothetical protein
MFGELFTQSSMMVTRRRLISRFESEHYTASVGGKTFHYSVKESPISGLGNEARALNVKARGYSQVNVWSVVYRADGFVGAVTIVGPDATAASAKKLASQAYAYARQSLH